MSDEPTKLDITDEMIAERRGSGQMPSDMPIWMATTITKIDLFTSPKPTLKLKHDSRSTSSKYTKHLPRSLSLSSSRTQKGKGYLSKSKTKHKSKLKSKTKFLKKT